MGIGFAPHASMATPRSFGVRSTVLASVAFGLGMDHEGPFAVRVTVDGPSGAMTLDTRVDATYDLRPPLPLLFVYLLPFVAVGFLWGTRLLKRRRARRM